MIDVVKLSTHADEVDIDVRATVDKIERYVKDRPVAGIAVAITFRDGASVTFASKSENRQKLIGAIVDMLFDYQGVK